MKNLQTKRSFTLIELMIVIVIMATLVTLAVINLSNTKSRATLNTSVTTLVTDIRGQQEKAMIGDTEGSGIANYYGINLGTSAYTVFRGITYSSTDPSNYVVVLGDQTQFANVTFPSSQIVFEKISGEVRNFVNGSNTFSVKNSLTNQQKTVTINRYGVITSIN